MLEERCAGEWFGEDVGEVVGGRELGEVDSEGCLCTSDHRVAGGDPFRLVRDAAASCAVDEDPGVGEDCGGAFGWETEFAEEDAETEDGFSAADGLEKLGGAGGVTDGGGQAA